MKKYKRHIIWGIITIIAFAGGIVWGRGMVSATAGGRGGAFAYNSSTRSGFAGPRNGPPGGGFTAGQVMSSDGESITLQLPNGNTENVYYSSSTQVVIPQASSISNVKTGDTIMVGGTQNSDGSMTATTIQVRGGTPSTGGSQN